MNLSKIAAGLRLIADGLDGMEAPPSSPKPEPVAKETTPEPKAEPEVKKPARRRAAPKKTEPETKPETEAEPEAEAEPETKESSFTIEDVVNAINPLAKLLGGKKVKAWLWDDFEAKNVHHIEPDRYDDVIASAKQMVADLAE